MASCDGYSGDELLIRDPLRSDSLTALSNSIGRTIDAGAERSALLYLLKLRKAGKLTTPATRRGDPVHPSVVPASHAENQPRRRLFIPPSL